MKGDKVAVLLALAVIAVVALATACAPGASAKPTPAATASAGGARDAPALALDKFQVDLGTLSRDQQAVETFLVVNWGDRPLQAGPASLQVEEGCDVTEVMAGTFQVPPRDVALLPIRFGPHRELGPHRFKVSVSSNGPALPVATASIKFVVAEEQGKVTGGPRLVVDKTITDTGAVPYDWPLYEQFVLRNEGDKPLVLQGEPQVRVEQGC